MAQLLLKASAIWQHLPGLSDNYRPGLYFSSLSQSLPPPETLKKNFFLILFIFGCAECCMLSFSSCGIQASHRGDFSCCRAPALEVWALVVEALRALDAGSVVAPRHVGSFWIRDWICVCCISRQILNHWTPGNYPVTSLIHRCYGLNCISPRFMVKPQHLWWLHLETESLLEIIKVKWSHKGRSLIP